MITTAKTQRRGGGARSGSQVVRLPDFDGIAAAPPGGSNARRREYYRRLLRYGMQRCLTEKQREAVFHYYIEGKKLREISEETGISSPTLSRRLSRARRRLLRFISDAAEVERMQQSLRAE